jgi:ribosomal protein L40E
MVEETKSKTTKQCPHCKSEIPIDARKCPQCQSDLRSWFRRHPILTVLGAFIMFIIVSSIIGGGTKKETKPQINQQTKQEVTQPSQEKAPEQPQATWQKVKSWQGTGIKKTEPFTITGKQWRIIWSIKDTSGINASILQIFVYKVGVQAPMEIVANVQGTANDTSYIYESGEFYLNINSANGNWAITVEELK